MIDAPADGRLDEVLRILADRVRRFRNERGLTVLALSFEAGISESRVRAIEAGRTTASLATLVALAETFDIGVSELFGDVARGEADAEPFSTYVVPSEVIWGGELPPAPWMTSTAAPERSPHVVPSEVVWGGELPAAPWTSVTAPAAMPETMTTRAPIAPASDPVPTEKTWGGPLPPAPWAAIDDAARGMRSAPAAAATLPLVPSRAEPTVASRSMPAAHTPERATEQNARAGARANEGTSKYVLVTEDTSAPREPRTFSDLREGVLAGREFRSLREFAIAAVVEADHSVVAVARVFRLPVWRLEQWVTEAGYISR